MGVPASEVGYNAAMPTQEGGPRSPQGHVVALGVGEVQYTAGLD